MRAFGSYPVREKIAVAPNDQGDFKRFFYIYQDGAGYLVQAVPLRPTPITCGRHSKEHIERGGYKKISLTLHLSPGPPVITLDQ